MHHPYWVTCYIISHPSYLRTIISDSPGHISPLPSSLITLLSLSIYLSLSLSLRLPPPPPSAAACPTLIPIISRVGCSHHCLDRCSPGFRSAARQHSLIGCVAMNCATMFWWRGGIHDCAYPGNGGSSPLWIFRG